MLNVAPQKERIPDHLRAMAEQDGKSAAQGKTGDRRAASSLQLASVRCAPGEERDSAIGGQVGLQSLQTHCAQKKPVTASGSDKAVCGPFGGKRRLRLVVVSTSSAPYLRADLAP